jgi:hypothetical protein
MLSSALRDAIPLLSCDGAERIAGEELGLDANSFIIVARLAAKGVLKLQKYLEQKGRSLGKPELFPLLDFRGNSILTFLYSDRSFPEIRPDELMEVLRKNALSLAQTQTENLVFGVIYVNHLP